MTSTEFHTNGLFILPIYSRAAQKNQFSIIIHTAWISRRDYIIHSHGLCCFFLHLSIALFCPRFYSVFAFAVLVSPYFLSYISRFRNLTVKSLLFIFTGFFSGVAFFVACCEERGWRYLPDAAHVSI